MPDPPTVEVRDASVETEPFDGWLVIMRRSPGLPWHCLGDGKGGHVFPDLAVAETMLEDFRFGVEGYYTDARIVHVADRVGAGSIDDLCWKRYERNKGVYLLCENRQLPNSNYCQEHQPNG